MELSPGSSCLFRPCLCYMATIAMVDNMINHLLLHKRNHIAMDQRLRMYSTNWATLLALMESRPLHVNKLTHGNKAAYQGLVDISKWGVGGVLFKERRTSNPLFGFTNGCNQYEIDCARTPTQTKISPYPTSNY